MRKLIRSCARRIKLVAGWLILLLLNNTANTQEARRHDVVIHEIFPDPAPVVGLPNSEFVEIRNISNTAFNLRNWKLTDGSASATIAVNYILQPDSMVVICPSAAAPLFAVFGQVIGVTGFPSLNNDGDAVSLLSPAGAVIHSVAYGLHWYKNSVKSEGGWTLEMIDAHNPCGSENNWGAAKDARGGTPGGYNSIQAANPDTQPPSLLRTYTADSTTIIAVFDEPLDSNAAGNLLNYTLDKGAVITNALPLPPVFREVYLSVNAFLPGIIYTLRVTDVTDCSGNSIGLMNTCKAGLPSEAATADIVINEILFNPLVAGTDYVELFNKSNKIVDASLLFLNSKSAAGNPGTPRKLCDAPYLIFPSDFVVATADASLVKAHYLVRYPPHLLTMPQIPSFPDDKGNVALLNSHGVIIDEVSYNEQWHFPLIVNREGIALERIRHDMPSTQQENWTSAAADAGFGTPTYRNSQFRSDPALPGALQIDPSTFSPDSDGRDDFCFIHYQLPSPGYMASVTIFDVNGTPVKNLVRNITISEKGVFRWDGLDDKGNKLATGIYIILTELFSLDGKKKNFKNPVTLAHAF